MFSNRSIAFLPLVVLVLAGPAFGQTTDGPSEVRRYVSALGGAAFADETIPTVAGEYGEAVTPSVFAYVNYSYYDNLMSDSMRGNLTLAAADFRARSGISRSFAGRDRGLALTMGAKFMPPTGSAFRPYFGGGAGALNLRRTITEQSLGDVTTVYLTESSFNDGVVKNATTGGATKPLVEAIAGVNVLAGRTYLDISYKYRRAFHVESLDFSQLGVAIGVTF